MDQERSTLHLHAHTRTHTKAIPLGSTTPVTFYQSPPTSWTRGSGEHAHPLWTYSDDMYLLIRRDAFTEPAFLLCAFNLFLPSLRGSHEARGARSYAILILAKAYEQPAERRRVMLGQIHSSFTDTWHTRLSDVGAEPHDCHGARCSLKNPRNT